MQDSDEPLKDDVGRDGLGPEHENYTGPDEGGGWNSTQGEPNFGERDTKKLKIKYESLIFQHVHFTREEITYEMIRGFLIE